MTTTLSCPTCGSQMRGYERNRVLVDQCTGCGGLFLDRGELEQLAAAEHEWHSGSSAAAPQDAAYAGQPRYDRDYQQGGHHGGYQQPYRKKKKKASFLSELFDD